MIRKKWKKAFRRAFLLGIDFGYMLCNGHCKPTAGPQRVTGHITEIVGADYKIIGEISQMELKEGQKVRVRFGGFKTKGGHAAKIQSGSARITSSDDSVVSVEADPNDETVATCRGLDGSGNESVTIEFRADGDPGEGVKEVIIAGTVICTQGDVATGEAEFGEPVDDDGGEPQPEPNPAPTGEPTTEPENPTPNPGPENPPAPIDGVPPAPPADNPDAGPPANPTPADGVEAGNPPADGPGTNENGVETGQPIDGEHTENDPNG
jgi:hypothetical protein